MKRGRFSQQDYQYVLECRVPSPPSELKSSVVSDEDDDELEEEELEHPTALVEELSASDSEEASLEPGVEVIRCVGDDVVAMEMVLPGERSEPFTGHDVVVRAETDGRCLLCVSDPEAQLVLYDGLGREIPGQYDKNDGDSIDVPRGGRAKVAVGERFILVRPVGLTGRSPQRGFRLGLAIAALVIACLAIMALTVSFLQWAIEM